MFEETDLKGNKIKSQSVTYTPVDMVDTYASGPEKSGDISESWDIFNQPEDARNEKFLKDNDNDDLKKCGAQYPSHRYAYYCLFINALTMIS